MEYILNNIFIRIIVGIFIGLPITAVALMGGAHGLVLGYAGIVNAKPGLFLLGVLTITGFVGIIGAWRRLFESTNLMSDKTKNKTRSMLFYGLVTSALLTAWAFFSEGLSIISLPLIMLTIGSMLFIMATPKSSPSD